MRKSDVIVAYNRLKEDKKALKRWSTELHDSFRNLQKLADRHKDDNLLGDMTCVLKYSENACVDVKNKTNEFIKAFKIIKRELPVPKKLVDGRDSEMACVCGEPVDLFDNYCSKCGRRLENKLDAGLLFEEKPKECGEMV